MSWNYYTYHNYDLICLFGLPSPLDILLNDLCRCSNCNARVWDFFCYYTSISYYCTVVDCRTFHNGRICSQPYMISYFYVSWWVSPGACFCIIYIMAIICSNQYIIAKHTILSNDYVGTFFLRLQLTVMSKCGIITYLNSTMVACYHYTTIILHQNVITKDNHIIIASEFKSQFVDYAILSSYKTITFSKVVNIQ